MLGTTRTSRLTFPTAFATTLLLGATLALSGCGAIKEAGAAAIVNGAVVSDQDVQTVSRQVTPYDPQAQNLSYVLVNLMIEPFVRAEAERLHKTMSDADVRKAVPKLVDPSPATIRYLQMKGALAQLDEPSKIAIGQKIDKAKITINPRYGTLDPAQGLIPTAPNWIKPTATSPAK